MAFGAAEASWYWPFGSDADSNRPRLSELMEKASMLIDDAEDLAADGKKHEAIEKYRAALAELAVVEAENPERAATTEFASLRNKRAYANAAIDTLLLAEARSNAKAVAVTDTTELEKRFLAARAGVPYENPAEKKLKPKEPVPEPVSHEKKPEATSDERQDSSRVEITIREPVPAAADTNGVSVVEVLAEQAIPGHSAKNASESAVRSAAAAKRVSEPAEKTKPAIVKSTEDQLRDTLRMEPRNRRARLALIGEYVKRQNFTGARSEVGVLLNWDPADASALNLKAVCEATEGNLAAAEKTLDYVIKLHPRDYNGYYNMAYLKLQKSGDAEVARRYYEIGRTLGGPRDMALEAQLR